MVKLPYLPLCAARCRSSLLSRRGAGRLISRQIQLPVHILSQKHIAIHIQPLLFHFFQQPLFILANYLQNINSQLPIGYQRPAVDQLLRFHVILFYPFQCQHQRVPYAQNTDVVQNLNAIVINDASNDATQHIVLYLITSR